MLPDLIAAYTRQARSDLQFRFDLLDLPLEPDADLYLALDTMPGGNPLLPVESQSGRAWDWLLVAPAHGQPALYQSADGSHSSESTPVYGKLFAPFALIPSPVNNESQIETVSGFEGWTLRTDAIPRLARDPWNDFVTLSLNSSRLGLPAGFYAQVFLASPGERRLYDSLPAFNSQSQQPGRGRALLAFWNSFPAATPAQALRRWDGAHTGPLGGRHGLHVLLQAARRSGIPLTLLDLKTPASLSALDTVGGTNLIKSLLAAGLLELPDVLPGWPGMESQGVPVIRLDPARAAAASRQAGLDFGLTGGRMVYASSLPAAPLHGYRVVFTPLKTGAPLHWQQQVLFPVPQVDLGDPQASLDGLTLLTRKALLQKALSGDPSPLLLGGDLAESTWGAAPAAEPSLRYLAAHPWIQVLSGDDLVGMSSLGSWKPGSLELGTLEDLSPGISSALADSSLKDLLAGAAFQTALALQAPLPPQAPGLLSMRAGYADLVGGLLAGSSWARNPGSISDCSSDPDLDGTAECVLASPEFFALFEPDGGRLVFLFQRDLAGVHEIVAPSAQFFAGLSDPMEWQPGAGAASDPSALPGAFAGPPPWPRFQAAISTGRITFTSPDGTVKKEYTLTDSGLEISLSSPGDQNVQIPLALDPWVRFSPDWSQLYTKSQGADYVKWSLSGGPQVEVRSDGRLSLSAFSDLLAEPPVHEDPNFDYPPGHYLPYPLAVVEIEAQGDLMLEINLTPSIRSTP